LHTCSFAGAKDDLADPKDLAYGLSLMPAEVKYVTFPTFGHLDFVWGDSSYTDLYLAVIEAVESLPQ
jgi:hypothetical protein